MGYITGFADAESDRSERVGGKGANLGRLTGAGFPVPVGFTVTTDAYRDFIGAGDLQGRIAAIADGLRHDDADAVEAGAADIRALIAAAEIPAGIAAEVVAAYAALGTEPYVAVRSSGTAEDLAEASFAGQHDTYLDVHGSDDVLAAVRDCWASLWTARALAYRFDKGFENDTVALAVVIQTMVESEVSGVMFTANPLTTVTDEIVVNAAWGLGEGIVSGIVSPDEVLLRKKDLTVKRLTVGPKQLKVVRDPDTGRGTVTQDVAPADQQRPCLSADQLAELGALGQRVAAYYDDMPQDIEWAYADGAFSILQSRDVTGVTFTWDEECDSWQTLPEREDTVWSRGYADQYLTGAITPLFYSVRTREFTHIHERFQRLLGFDDLADQRPFRYYKAEAYYNSTIDATYYTYILPQSFRPGAFAMSPKSMIEEALNAPFSVSKYIRSQARVALLAPDQSVYRWFKVIDDYLKNRVAEADGLTLEQLTRLSDRELMRYADSKVELADRFIGDEWVAFFVYAPSALFLLSKMLEKWYDGDNSTVFTDLLTGLPNQSTTLDENLAIWELAEEIRGNPELHDLFTRFADRAFFEEASKHAFADRFLERYRALVAAHGHRGSADRDFFYDRRVEDPGLDYRAFQVFLRGESVRPDEREKELAQQRVDATAEVLERIAAKPLGFARVEAFKLVLDYCHRFLVVRDDQRHYVDRFTLAKKRAFREIGDRLLARGIVESPTDFYFLSKEELYEAFAGHANERLMRAKIAGRRTVHARFDAKEELPPPYVVENVGVDLDGTESVPDSADGVYAGLGTSRGSYTGVARVVTELSDIGRVQKGDVLITNSTDPGWTPVFMVIGALVLETGGMLSHGACLSREYGFPSTTVPNAAKRIPEGARVTVNGDTGQVIIHPDSALDDEAVDDAPVPAPAV